MLVLDTDGLVTLYLPKRAALLDRHAGLFAEFRMFFTETGVDVPGITAKLDEIPVFKSVKTKAKTSLNPHWNSPYSLEANKKSKLNRLEIGTKSNWR